MSDNEWGKIIAEKTNDELFIIYNARAYEPERKVNAVIKELIKRGLIDKENESLITEIEEKTSQPANSSYIKDTRPNGDRAKLARSIIIIIAIIDVVSLVSAYMQYNLLQSVKNGEYISRATAEANDSREAVIGIIMLIFMVISIVTFIQWFRRAYFNLHLRTSKCAFTEGWAAGAWFVPILNLFRPYQIMKEMNDKTDILLIKRKLDKGTDISFIIGLWWTLWILSNVISNISFRLTFNGETVVQFIQGTMFDLISTALHIPLSIVAIFVIQNYSKKEEILYNSEKMQPESNIIKSEYEY